MEDNRYDWMMKPLIFSALLNLWMIFILLERYFKGVK